LTTFEKLSNLAQNQFASAISAKIRDEPKLFITLKTIKSLKIISIAFALGGSLAGGYFYTLEPHPVATSVVTQEVALMPTPRQNFKPSSNKGYWNIDIVDDFVCPPTKTIVFCGAGRNLHIKQSWDKLFRRGFSAIDLTRMTADEINTPYNTKPPGWKSRLAFSQRALWVGAAYFANSPFELEWARNSNVAPQTLYDQQATRQTLAQAMRELAGGCDMFGDCPPKQQMSTFSKIFLDIENDGIDYLKRQEQANLYIWMMYNLKKQVSPKTEIGSIAPIPHNDYGYSRASAYRNDTEWLWNMPAKHTATSRQRGMGDEIVGKTFESVTDIQMPGTYYVYPDFDYNITHNADADRHWLASLLGEQEVNAKLSLKKRMSWQWLFNTQSAAFDNSGRSEHPAPPAVAEGMAIFYWFTGAAGTILWDDAIDLVPNNKSETDPAKQGTVSDRYYQCYEHYLHGLWRLFKHHNDMFDGKEQYLNDQTECSFDGGKTWWRYNANQLKTRNLPFVRAIVNDNQILIAATKPYTKPTETTIVKVRYTEKGYRFETTITLRGDEIFLGKSTM
jgi:hypothetical protein